MVLEKDKSVGSFWSFFLYSSVSLSLFAWYEKRSQNFAEKVSIFYFSLSSQMEFAEVWALLPLLVASYEVNLRGDNVLSHDQLAILKVTLYTWKGFATSSIIPKN